MADQLDGGEALLDALRTLGVDYIFSSPGSEWAPVWEAMARQRRDGTDGPTYIDLTHETLAVAMATGYWLVTREMQAVLLHATPGLLQGANAVHGALLTGAPMVVASSESVSYGEGHIDPGMQWYRNLSVVGGTHPVAAPWVKWSQQAPTVELIWELTRRAGEIAQRPSMAPVYLNVALEAMLEPWEKPEIRRDVAKPGKRVTPQVEIDALVDDILAASNPVVMTESIGRDPEGFAALVEFAEAFGIGVIEPQGVVTSNFPKQHPLHLGSAPNAVEGADLVLMVNCRAPWYPPSKNPVPDAKIVVIDEVAQRPHIVYQVLQAHSYLEGYVPDTLRAAVETGKARGLDSASIAARAEAIKGRHDKVIAKIFEEEAEAEGLDKITGPLLVKTLREVTDDDAIFLDETITHTRFTQRHLLADAPQRWMYVQGGLGQGSGVALGAKLAAGDREVVWVVGDGTFLYNPIVQALMASRDQDLPLLIVIFNNREYLSMKYNHLRFYPEGIAKTEDDHDGVDLSTQPALSEFGEPFGFKGFEVSEPGELRAAVEAAHAEVKAGKTAILNVQLEK